jgi:hypothetical protein
MIQELNKLRGYGKNVELELKDGLLNADHLTAWSFALYKSMPLLFQQQLATMKDSYGNVDMTRICSEKIFAQLCTE